MQTQKYSQVLFVLAEFFAANVLNDDEAFQEALVKCKQYFQLDDGKMDVWCSESNKTHDIKTVVQ